jgi:hypothetical protein
MILGICVVVFIALLALLVLMGGGSSALIYFADIPSLAAVIILPLIMLIGAGYIKDFFKVFHIAAHREISFLHSELMRARNAVSFAIKSVLLSGGITAVTGFIAVAGASAQVGPTDRGTLLVNLGVAAISALYGFIFAFLLMPLRAQAEQRLADMNDP